MMNFEINYSGPKKPPSPIPGDGWAQQAGELPLVYIKNVGWVGLNGHVTYGERKPQFDPLTNWRVWVLCLLPAQLMGYIWVSQLFDFDTMTLGQAILLGSMIVGAGFGFVLGIFELCKLFRRSK